MALKFLKAERVVSAALGLLSRESVLPKLVWRDAAGDFAGARDDTISIHLPAYTFARTRDLRSGDARTRDSLSDRKVDVTLDTDVYKDVRITDEELTLDIKDFGEQVLAPIVQAHARKLEDIVVDEMQDASYAKSLSFSYASDDAWSDLIIPARELLNKANVPMQGRTLAVGSGIETALLSTDLFVKANESGSTSALSEALISRKAGFDIVSVPALGPNEAYAFHKSAYVMSERAPVVPAGAPYGTSLSFDGFAIRAVRVLDSATIEDILATDSWVGTNIVTDDGYFDSDGKFNPTEGELGSEVTLQTSAAADDIIDATAHGFIAGDRVSFTALTGGTGLSTNRDYYVIAANLAANTFQVSATPGGAAVNFTTDVTAGTVRKGGSPLFVRSVKITAA